MIEIVTRMRVEAAAERVYGAFVGGREIGKFWFSRSSGDWQAGADVVLSYDEFEARVPIHIEELRTGSRIRFSWGPQAERRVVTISLTEAGTATLVEVKEQGFQEYEDLLGRPELAQVRTFEYEEIVNTLMSGKGGWTFVLTCLKAYLENGVTTLRTGLVG